MIYTAIRRNRSFNLYLIFFSLSVGVKSFATLPPPVPSDKSPNCSLNRLTHFIQGIDSWLKESANQTLHSTSVAHKFVREYWIHFENHNLNTDQLVEIIKAESDTSSADWPFIDIIQRLNERRSLADCSEKCTNVELDKVYESVFAAIFVRLRDTSTNRVPAPIQAVLQKVLNAIPDFEKHLADWSERTDNEYQIAKRVDLPISERINRVQNTTDIALVMDFLYSYFYSIKDDERESCYSEMILKEKGTRTRITDGPKTSYLGLVELEYLFQNEVPPYFHPYLRDQWLPRSSVYITSIEQLHLPLICSISGNGNIHLFGLAKLSNPLNPQELRIYLLALWVTLTADGGHVLQELLTSAKLVSHWMNANYDSSSFIQHKLALSLHEVAQPIAPIGLEMGHYYTDFFSHFVGDEWFETLRGKTQREFMNIWGATCGKVQ